jgi:dTDP-4-amino-4,6-dideoxygalactose transaminase
VSDAIPFALPDVTELEIEAAVAAIRSGWLSSGPAVRQFEEDFAAFVGSGVEAVAVNSATAGLHLALEACGVKAGDEVLVPTWTFTATAEVVRYLGAAPIFVDIDRETLNLDFEDAKRRVTAQTVAIIPVHFAGLPLSPTALREFATQHNLRVVEDAAHAVPASSQGQSVGAGESDATVFSFYATKTMTTGEGGMVVTRNPQLAERVRTMRLHGINRDAFDRYRSTTPSWRYDVVDAGYKYNLTDPAAAMGIVQLSRVHSMRSRRADIAATYDAAFRGLPIQLPTAGDESVLHSWHLYVIRLEGGRNRDRAIEELAELGIGTSVHFIPLHLQPYWRDRAQLVPADYPVASSEFERVISLPIFSSMSDEQVQRVITSVLTVCGK